MNTNSRLDSYNCSTVPNYGDSVEGHSQPFTSFSCQPSPKAFNGIACNKRQRTKGSFHKLNTTGAETLPMSNAETLSNIVEGYPSLLRDTIARLSKESNDRNKKERKLSKDMDSNSRLDSYTYGTTSNCGDPTEGHSQPFTLSALYEREDKEKKEAEGHAKNLQSLTSGLGQKKIKLFSWLKGDSMLLNEDDQELIWAASKPQQLLPTPCPQQHIPSSSAVIQMSSYQSLGIPNAYTSGRLPTTFSSMSTTELLTQAGGLCNSSVQKQDLSSSLRSNRNSTLGTGKLKSSFRNESFCSSQRNSSVQRWKKQVSFSLNHNDTFPV